METRPLRILTLLAVMPFTLSADSVNLAEPGPQWGHLFAELKAPARIRSSFRETRRNPFHRFSREFQGVMRWAPECGLSIQYTEPRGMVIHVMPQSVTIKEEGEPAREESAALDSGILPMISRLFGWDTAWMEDNFDASGDWQKDGAWVLSLSPLEESLSLMVDRIVLEGIPGTLTTITVHARGGREIEIELLENERDPVFTEEEIKEAFPGKK